MSTSCLTCLSDQNLAVLSKEEWSIFDFILHPFGNGVSDNSKLFLEEIKSCNMGRICTECQYTMQCMEKFRKTARESFTKLIETWNERCPSISYSGTDVDPLAGEEVNIKLEPYDKDGDGDEKSIKQEDLSDNECLTAPSSPSTVSVKSDDIRKLKEEVLDIDNESEPFLSDIEMQIEMSIVDKNPTHKIPVDPLPVEPVQLKGSPIQKIRVTSIGSVPNDPGLTRSPIQAVRVTPNSSVPNVAKLTRPFKVIRVVMANGSVQNRIIRSSIQGVRVMPNSSVPNDPKLTRSSLRGVRVMPNTSVPNDPKLTRSPLRGVRVMPNTSVPNDPKLTRSPIQGVRVMPNTSVPNDPKLTRFPLQGGVPFAAKGPESIDLDPEPETPSSSRKPNSVKFQVQDSKKKYAVMTKVNNPVSNKSRAVPYSESFKQVRPKDCQCRLCYPEAFINRPNESPEPTPVYQCPMCDKVLPTKKALRNHKYVSHKSKEVYEFCKPCDKWIPLPKFNNHLKTSSEHVKEEDSVLCKECNKRVYKPYLGTHMRQNHIKTDYCKTCDKWFTKSEYKKHLATNLRHVSKDNYKFTCELCNGKYVCLRDIDRHMQVVHLKMLPYKCPHCKSAFKGLRMLKKHMLTVHEKKPVPKNVICHICGSAWETAGLLENHLVVHTGERRHKCKVCDATFGHKGALYTHNKLKHLKEKSTTKKKRNPTKKKQNPTKKKQNPPKKKMNTRSANKKVQNTEHE